MDCETQNTYSLVLYRKEVRQLLSHTARWGRAGPGARPPIPDWVLFNSVPLALSAPPCNTAHGVRFQAAGLWAGSAPGHTEQPRGVLGVATVAPMTQRGFLLGAVRHFRGKLAKRCQQAPASAPRAKQEKPVSVRVGLEPARCWSYSHRLSRSAQRRTGISADGQVHCKRGCRVPFSMPGCPWCTRVIKTPPDPIC